MVSGRGSTVTTYFDGDTKGLERAVTDATNAIGKFARTGGTSFARMTGAFAVGDLAASALRESARQLGAQLRVAVDESTKMVETQNKVNEVFGNSSRTINDWSDNAANSLGVSQRAALDAAGTFGNMFIQLGLGQDDAAGLSKQMVQLAADIGSFHNADISDVIAAQTSAFRGEYDAVQRYVPTINAATVEQKALEMGLAGSSKELSMQDKALATHRLLMEGAGSATGDFARTAGSLANQQRILSANIETLQGKIGTALLPVMTDIVTKMNEWIDTNGDQFAKDFGEAVDGAAEKLGALYKLLQDIRNSSPYQAVIKFVDGEGNVITAATLAALGFKVGGAAVGVPAAVGALAYGATQIETREGGALGQRPTYPAGVPAPTRIQAGARQPTASEFVRNLEGFPWSNPDEANVFGDLFMQKGAAPAGKPGTGEKLPTGSGGGKKADFLTPETLGLIEQIMTGLPSLKGGNLDQSFLNEYRAVEQQFKGIRDSVNRDLNELQLTLADLDARGMENTDTFKGLEDRANGLKDALARIDLVEQLRLGPAKDAVEALADAEDKLLEARKRERDWMLGYLQQLGSQNTRFAPGVFEGLARAGGLTPIGEFTNITQTNVATGATSPVDVVVP